MDLTHFAMELQPQSIAGSKCGTVREFCNYYSYHTLMFNLVQSLYIIILHNICVVWCQLLGEYLILPQKKLN